MRCLQILSGIISCLIVGILCQNVSIKETDRSVMPSNATTKVNVTFTCIGSNPELSYYIKNSVIWRFTDAHGIVQNISQGFSKDPYNQYAAAKFNDNSFDFQYLQEAQGQRRHQFILHIFGVRHSDNGIYTCALKNGSEIIIDSKQVILTVINPVESLNLELLDSNDKPLVKSNTLNGQRIRAGQYMVKCTAQNSNPAPYMQFFLNEVEETVDVFRTQKLFRFNGTFKATVHLSPRNTVQTLECTAGIQSHEFDLMKTAIINVSIPIEKPIVSCTNLSAYEKDTKAKIECSMTAASEFSPLNCTMVQWMVGDINQFIAHEEMWMDDTENYNIITASCHVVIPEKQLHVTLEFNELKEKHFKSLYFVIYGRGDSASKHPIEIYQLFRPSSASPTLQLSMSVYVSMAIVVSKQLIRYL